jgi:hypothetical protein
MNQKTNDVVSVFGNQKRWVIWKYEVRDGKPTKVPYQINGKDKAESNNPDTWTTYENALKASNQIGIVFTPDKLLLGIDFDDCLENGKIVGEDSDKIERLLAEVNTYTEISPSGTGLHSLVLLSEPFEPIRKRKGDYEIYTSGRFFTFTHNTCRDFQKLRTMTAKDAVDYLSIIGYPWKEKSEQDNKNSAKPKPLMDDKKLLTKMFYSKNGVKIQSLYYGNTADYQDDDSSADLALCSHLAFWTAKNVTQIERMWLNSPLGQREKTQKRKDYRDRTINTAIENCNKIYDQKKNSDKPNEESLLEDQEVKSKRTSQADLLLKLIEEKKGMELFHDERGNSFVLIRVEDHNEILSCKSKEMKNWLSHEFWKKYKKGIGSEALSNVLNVIEGRAKFEGKKHTLNNRMGWKDECLWYDLTNNLWQAVRITKSGWELVFEPPILFKRYTHHKPQVFPSKECGDASLILNYVNIENDKHRLLVLVMMISYFIPDFPHPIFLIYGPQGSAKTTFARLLRLIIDPSLLEAISLPYKYSELVQILDHHAFPFFDNVSVISSETSDILCKAVTGGGFSKRELFTDEGDIIYNFKRCIGINGINIVATRPDLLERSVLIELMRIDPKKRKEEADLMNRFEKDLPIILAGIFDVLAKAIEIKPTIELSSSPRMADFTKWGCAISQALGYTQEEFLEAYKENIDQQSEIVVSDNIVASAVVEFMENKKEWGGTPTELLNEIELLGFLQGIDSYEQYWPKSSGAFTRKLNELKINLQEVGIIYSTTKGVKRKISLKKSDHIDPNSALPLEVEGGEKDDKTV